MQDIIKINHTKQVVSTVVWGEVVIYLGTDNAWHLEYHNPVYKNSPYRLTISFARNFTVEQILKSREVVNFLNKFN